LTILIGVEPCDERLPAHLDGSLERLRRWIRSILNQGTTIEVFTDFIDSICSDIENTGLHHHNFFDTDNNRYFLWDILNSQLSPLVIQLVEGWPGQCNFSSIPRPPYQLKYGPIEYVICWIASRLAKLVRQNWTTATMEQEIRNVFASMRDYVNYFDHCGYTNDGNY